MTELPKLPPNTTVGVHMLTEPDVEVRVLGDITPWATLTIDDVVSIYCYKPEYADKLAAAFTDVAARLRGREVSSDVITGQVEEVLGHPLDKRTVDMLHTALDKIEEP